MTKPRAGAARPRLPALDGLRGVGILAVIAYHLNPSWLPGGYLGVDIFFVVSGFLITGLLLDLFRPGSPVGPGLRRFWARRARRLLPGLIVLLFGVAVAASIVAHDAVPELRADIPAALGFVANWRLLLHHDNYFQALGRPPLLQHLWSLGVEEQFYLLWPFAVVAIVRAVPRQAPKVLAWAALVGAVASALAMAILFVPGHDPSNVYYNTFTHASGLLIGSGLVGVTRHRRRALGAAASRRRAQVGLISCAGLVASLIFLRSGDTFTYRGGIFLASAVTGLVLLISLQPGPVRTFLCGRPLRYLGTRSYSLYLWHWPIICLTRPDIDIQLSGWSLLVLRLGLIGLAGEASYRLVEQPFRTGRAQAALRAWRKTARTAAAGAATVCGATAVMLLALTNPPALSAALADGSTPAARVPLPPVRSSITAPVTSTPTTSRPPTGSATAPGLLATTTTADAGAAPPTTGPPTTVTIRATTPKARVPTSARWPPVTAPPATGGTTSTMKPIVYAGPPPSTETSPTSAPSRAPVTTYPLVTTLPSRPAHLVASPNTDATPTTAEPSTAATPPTTAGPGRLPITSTTVAGLGPTSGGGNGASGPGPAKVKLGHDVLAIGDSVMVAGSAALEQRLHGDITVDAVVGRQVWTGLSRLQAYREAGDLVGLKAIVIDLGTNGPMTPLDVAQFRALAAGVPLLVFVNVRVPRPWQAETNRSIDAVAGQPGIKVVNWYAAANASLLWPDGIHPDPKGQLVYAALIASALGTAG